MESAKQFEEYAAECLDWAKTARTEKERATFVQMASAWLHAASVAHVREGAHGREGVSVSARDQGNATA
jgi:hypothetical protein